MQILIRLLGLGIPPSQDEIFELAGGRPLSVESFAKVMSTLTQMNAQPARSWLGIGAAPPDGHEDASLLPVLSETGPWVAHLREPGKKLGHFVVVIAVSNEGLMILDPWENGTRYVMTVADFLSHWTFQVVYSASVSQ